MKFFCLKQCISNSKLSLVDSNLYRIAVFLSFPDAVNCLMHKVQSSYPIILKYLIHI